MSATVPSASPRLSLARTDGTTADQAGTTKAEQRAGRAGGRKRGRSEVRVPVQGSAEGSRRAVQLLTQDEVARMLGIDRLSPNQESARRTIKAMCRRGELVGVRVSRWILVDAVSVEAYVAGKR